MTQTNNPTQLRQSSLALRMIVGGVIGLLVISLFIFGFEPNPEWGKYWRIRPLVITPLAGAMGGLCNYFIMSFYHQFRVNKIIAMVLSALVFVIGLWLGIVLGLDGTMWD